MDKIRIVVIDDHPIFRQGVIDVFTIQDDLEVVGEADNGEDAVQLIRALKPDIAIVDVNLPAMNGQQVMRQVILERLPTRIILLTAYDDFEQMVHAMRGGAFAYCAKDVQPEHLMEIIRQVNSGKYILGDQVLDFSSLVKWLDERMQGAYRAYGDPGEPYYPLSDREMEILTYITRGLSNKEIARTLGISHQTVKNHVTSLLRKLGVDDRTQAAIYALRRGWVRLSNEDDHK